MSSDSYHFNWLAADAYLFDIDGTLLNTRDGVHYYAFLHALKDHFGIDASLEGVPVHGNTDVGILRAVVRRAGVSDTAFEEKLPLLIQQMSDEVESKQAEIRADLCPAIPELLQSLHTKGKLLGIVTGNFERIAWAKLTASGLKQYFSFGSFSDVNERRSDIFENSLQAVRDKLGPKSKAYVVGDTPADIAAAREIGIPIISVATGIYPRTDLAALSPDLSVECCSDLLALSRRSLSREPCWPEL
ncbi:MAG TPA: HAD family hydrolase [Terriglobales bacterium]|nr:HAD family hydrolase [Terriglobales bacterium]